jgi:formylglycine-generating enzyme required for sulfatase activity
MRSRGKHMGESKNTVWRLGITALAVASAAAWSWATPRPSSAEESKPKACPDGMASIPGGTYTMGDRRDAVTVAAFCLDKTAVTAGAYASCVSSGACPAESASANPTCNFRVVGREKHPMNCVDWGSAATYCSAQGKRLATEEEREWAARGGHRGTTYPWGNDEPDFQLCWSGVSARSETCPVGSFPKGNSPDGVSDLAGNVWEWTSSKYAPTDAACVDRGGSWYEIGTSYMRAAFRSRNTPSRRLVNLGFRCARSL